MRGIKKFIIIPAFILLYAASPIDILPGLPFDDIIVAGLGIMHMFSFSPEKQLPQRNEKIEYDLVEKPQLSD